MIILWVRVFNELELTGESIRIETPLPSIHSVLTPRVYQETGAMGSIHDS